MADGSGGARRLAAAMDGFLATQLLYVAAKLGVADALAGGPRSGDEVARAVGADRNALTRVLRGLAAEGIVDEVGDGRFALAAPGESLRGAQGAVVARGELYYRAAAGLLDVGGGGVLLSAILRAAPALRGVLLDRPAAIDAARRRLEADGVADRAECVAGDFFEAVPPGADPTCSRGSSTTGTTRTPLHPRHLPHGDARPRAPAARRGGPARARPRRAGGDPHGPAHADPVRRPRAHRAGVPAPARHRRPRAAKGVPDRLADRGRDHRGDTHGGADMMREARLKDSDAGLVAASEGWFVVNVRDAAWVTSETFGPACIFEGDDAPFADLGFTLAVLEPGRPSGLYHAEANQEDFLVLAGECLLLVEGEERRLRAWDFVHCPAGTEHIFVGAGDGRCLIFMAGGRSHPYATEYPRSDLALRHGAGAHETTRVPAEAYAPFDGWRPGRPPGWNTLPWA
jgi:uncharacterized cupin superfamily protein